MLLFSYSSILLAFVRLGSEEGEALGASLGIGLGLVPLVFAVAAFGSSISPVFPAVMKATGLWVILAIPIGIFDLVTGLVAGFGAGGVVAFRLDQAHSRRRRVWAVGLVALYTFVLLRVAPAAALFGGAVLPFLAIGFADEFSGRRTAVQDDGSDDA